MPPVMPAALAPSSPNPWLRFDIWLFQRLGAGRGPRWLMALAKAVARWSWLPLLALVVTVSAGEGGGVGGVLWALLVLLQAGLLQWIGKKLARHWSAQRPFVLGLCANHLGHGGRAGFPSSHALVMGAVLGALLPHTGSDALLMAMVAVAMGTGWARVHTGTHFPTDVLAGLAAGLVWGLLFGIALPG